MFKKADLSPDYDYNYHHNESGALIIQLPKTNVLNRNEPYEMLYFINSFAKEKGWDKSWNLYTIKSCRKIETMIKTKLPANIDSKEKIKAWLIDNWDKY